MSRFKPVNLVLTVAIAVVTGAWLIAAILVNFYYWDPSPGFDGRRIVLLSAKTVRTGRPAPIYGVTAQRIKQTQMGLVKTTAFQPTGLFVTRQDSLPHAAYGLEGTLDFFEVFSPSSHIPDLLPGTTTLILSRSLASRLFSAPERAIGKALSFEGRRRRVSHVIDDIDWPTGLFSLPGPVEFFLLSDEPPKSPEFVAGRLEDGGTLNQVEQLLSRVLSRSDAWPPGVVSSHLTGSVQSLDDRIRLKAPWVPGILAGCTLLLLLAQATTVQLLFHDIHKRARIWVIHTVLGATRRQIIALYLQRLLPNFLLGAGFGSVATLLLINRFGQDTPLLRDAGLTADMTLPTLRLFLALLATLGLVAGIPLLFLGRVEFHRGLFSAMKPSRWTLWSHSLFPAFQLALLAAIVTLGHSVHTLYSQKTENAAGLRQADLFYVRIYTPREFDAAAQVKHLPRLVRSLQASPKVNHLALSRSYLPLLADGYSGLKIGSGNIEQTMKISRRIVSSNFFDVLGLSRPPHRLNERIRDQVLIGASLADALSFEQGDYPISLRVGLSTVTVLGEVPDTVDFSLTKASEPSIYYPLVVDELVKWPFLVLRASEDSESIQRLVENELLRLNVQAFVAPVINVEKLVEDRLAFTRFFYSMFVGLAAFVVFVASCSVVVTVRREIASRLHEAAVRQALGATSSHIWILLMRRITAVGVLGILGGSLVGTHVSGTLAVALGSSASLNDAAIAFVLVFACALAVSAWSCLSSSRMEPSDLLRKGLSDL